MTQQDIPVTDLPTSAPALPHNRTRRALTLNRAALQERIDPAARTLHNVFQRILQQVAYIAPGGSSLRPLLHKWRGVHMGNRYRINSRG